MVLQTKHFCKKRNGLEHEYFIYYKKRFLKKRVSHSIYCPTWITSTDGRAWLNIKTACQCMNSEGIQGLGVRGLGLKYYEWLSMCGQVGHTYFIFLEMRFYPHYFIYELEFLLDFASRIKINSRREKD